ncbi:MAG: serine/threonine protein kinase [Vicinamibacteria bacterium]|nr:serine/threonine protein kinase [Vicinamibacteria bacterium]
MSTPPPSQIGRYRIERELGRGTMGVVYQARDTTLGRTVALKTFGTMAAIAPHEREAFEQRFLSEARISATLDDQHVVAVYDVGRDFESGLLFMALEYVRGETLASALGRGPMPWREAVVITIKVARALQAAHSHHIVHRDIKPANIMISASGEPKIMDFGIAKASAAQLTVAGQVFGTPAYMSPEQASGEEVDGRSDIFSLGAVLYELVTNTRPFEGPTMAATLTKIVRDEPRPASGLVQVPRSLDAVIARALRKSRDARYDSAAHFATDLECVLDGKPPVHATQLGPLETVALSGSQVPRRPTTMPKIVHSTPRSDEVYVVADSSKHGPIRLAVAVALGVILGVGVVLVLQQRTRPEAPAPVPESTARPVPTPTPRPPAPTPIQTPTPTVEPTAEPLSVEASGRAARVSLDLRHPFASGTLRIKVDDRVVFANNISGMPKKVMGVVSGYDGRFGTDFVIPPGEHVIRIEVRSGPTELAESRKVKLRAGETRRLLALAGKNLTLSLE